MEPMYLPGVEHNPAPGGPYANLIAAARARGADMPQIWHMLSYKPAIGEALSVLSQAIMRGDSPLSPGLRELIAAFTSKGNHCLF